MKRVFEGNNPIDLASQSAEAQSGKGTPAIVAAQRLNTLGIEKIPTALENYSAWDRERSLGRGSQQRGGNMVRYKVRSNAFKDRTEIIDDVVLRFDANGVATVPAGQIHKIEKFMAARPGRLSIEKDEHVVPSIDEQLAAAKAAMAPQPVVVEAPADAVDAPEVSAILEELGVDPAQVDASEEDLLPLKKQGKKPSKKKEKE